MPLKLPATTKRNPKTYSRAKQETILIEKYFSLPREQQPAMYKSLSSDERTVIRQAGGLE